MASDIWRLAYLNAHKGQLTAYSDFDAADESHATDWKLLAERVNAGEEESSTSTCAKSLTDKLTEAKEKAVGFPGVSSFVPINYDEASDSCVGMEMRNDVLVGHENNVDTIEKITRNMLSALIFVHTHSPPEDDVQKGVQQVTQGFLKLVEGKVIYNNAVLDSLSEIGHECRSPVEALPGLQNYLSKNGVAITVDEEDVKSVQEDMRIIREAVTGTLMEQQDIVGANYAYFRLAATQASYGHRKSFTDFLATLSSLLEKQTGCSSKEPAELEAVLSKHLKAKQAEMLQAGRISYFDHAHRSLPPGSQDAADVKTQRVHMTVYTTGPWGEVKEIELDAINKIGDFDFGKTGDLIGKGFAARGMLFGKEFVNVTDLSWI